MAGGGDLVAFVGDRIAVAVLGATGSVGQRFVALLADHPWFRVAALAASERTAGRPYGEAVRWVQSTPLPPDAAALPVLPSEPPLDASLVFSALDAGVAGPVEEAFARAGCLVVSNARSHRYDPDVPLVVPEVNADHLAAAKLQTFGGGAILTNPNCSTIGLVLALKPLADAFGLKRVNVVTMQALSGAGLPGVPSFEMLDNLIPYIGDEEEKIERETRKILGSFSDGRFVDADVTVSAACNRVAVLDGHTECISVSLARPASMEEVVAAWESYRGEPQRLSLPSAPRQPVHYHRRPDAPQPRLHRDLDSGMAASVGRLRPCPLFDYKFVALSHNTVRGAAGGALLLAELAVAKGLLPGAVPTTLVHAAS
jgi:aspartate-semialdehyde dehydrogenase